MYRSEGASRRRRRAGAGAAGYAAAVWRPGQWGAPFAYYRMGCGIATNNVAEYLGLRASMERAVRVGDPIVVFEVDSKMVADGMAQEGAAACKSKDLMPLHIECRGYGKRLTEMGIEWEVRHIYREFNQSADALANDAIDDEAGNGPSDAW